MSAIFGTLLVFTVIALGMESIRDTLTFKAWRERRANKKQGKEDESVMTEEFLRAKQAMNTFCLALKNEGYFGEVRRDDPKVIINETLAMMANRLAEEHDLMWLAPHYRLRIKKLHANEVGDTIYKTYQWAILTPDHAILFNGPKEGKS